MVKKSYVICEWFLVKMENIRIIRKKQFAKLENEEYN
jgi:hypothetical protein